MGQRIPSKFLICMAAIVAIQIAVLPGTPVQAQPGTSQSGTPGGGLSPEIQSIINAHPAGGAALAEAIHDAIAQNPSLAQGLIAATQGVPDRRILGAMAAGLARAQISLTRQNPDAANMISQLVQANADPVFQTAFHLERGQQLANSNYLYGFVPLSRTGIVSPSRP